MTQILVVEDDPTISAILVDALDDEGYRVVAAPTGNYALDLLRRVAPDVILLDVRLPDRDGLWVCQQLAAAPQTRHIPVVLCTVLRETAIPAGCPYDAYLAKPFDLDALFAVVRQVLRTPGRATIR